jgi:hypothetical protein
MKKLLFVCLALVFVLAMFVPQGMAKNEKIEFCHATDFFDVPQNEWTLIVGHVIEVSIKALPAHFAHGDFVYEDKYHIDELAIFGLTWRQVAENNGLDLEGVDCSGFVNDLD